VWVRAPLCKLQKRVMQMKRYDNVAFPQVLHMDRFVYSKSAMKDQKGGLVGGRDDCVFRYVIKIIFDLI
jgi:hypothetical protein